MPYHLSQNLSCCDVDGHMIFLDIAQDRYFKLSDRLEEATRRFLAHEGVAPNLLGHLETARILVKTTDVEARATTARIQRPSCSAIEQTSPIAQRRLGAAIAIEVVATVWATRRRLRVHALKATLDEAIAYRDRKATPRETNTQAPVEAGLLHASRQFARARRYAPIEPVCLLDSLSLLWFLSRRGLSANIVFGVMPEPFAAHCWVQAGAIVLNETLSDANAYTPIRMV